MALIAVISGSPSPGSRTLLVGRVAGDRIRRAGHDVEEINVRELPAEALLSARTDVPAISAAVGLVERAAGVVIATPIYKAAYAGVLKTFLDLLPQFALQGKAVLPLATGGTLAHVLAIDYGLRPVLASLGNPLVVGGLFLLDKQLEKLPDGSLRLDDAAAPRLDGVVDDFLKVLR
jgi:FMN reductase